MLRQKTYSCAICKTKPDQISHHKSHLETQKHKDKKELFELKISKLSNSELEEQYNNTIIIEIVNTMETIIFDNDIKLNGNNNNNIHHNNENMIYNQVQYSLIMEESNSISNRDALKDKIHEIHNFLRNNGAGYGMNALKVFNILYGLKKIEENNLLDKVNLQRPICEFSHLLKLANENKDEELAELIFGGILTSISQSNIRDLLFYEIPQNIKGSVFVYLVKEINKITMIEKTCNVLLSGKIYEYFIGRDESAISELGAYFTDRHIVDYIYQKLKPTIYENGKIGSMIDMFGGSGGFTTGYINYINQHSPTQINWETEINKIYHYDMNEDVIKSAGLEFFCLTGVLPNMKNLKYKNSFTDEFVDTDGRTHKKYKYVITNPPYGGDSNKKTEAQMKREKIKEYIKKDLPNITDEEQLKRRNNQLKRIDAQEKTEKLEQNKTKVSVQMCSARIQRLAKNNNLKGNDKEACSLMLMMDLVDIGGTCIGVLKEGVFFSKAYKDLRKCLIENFNVKEVISVPQDQFENTSTKTSIIIFENTEEKTKEVVFSDLVVEKYEEDTFQEIMGYIILRESKGDIKGIRDKVISTASVAELLGNAIISLNGKDYNKKEIVCGEGYELKNFDKLCKVMLGTRITKNNNIEGDFPVYGGGDITFYTNNNNRNENTLIISRYALSKTCVRLLPHKFYLNDSGLSIHCMDNTLQEFINYYLLSKATQDHIYSNCTSGSIQRNLNMNLFNNIQIPIPKSQEKIKEWVDKISKPYNSKIQKETRFNELQLQIQNRIKEITENEECDEVVLGSICDFINGKKRNTIEGKENGLYPLFSSSLNIDNWINEYDYNEKSIIINTINGSGKFNLHYCKNFCATSNTIIFNTDKVNLLYLYYYCIQNINTINSLANGSTKKKMGKNEISKLKIKIPKNKQYIQDMEILFQEIETLQPQIKEEDDLYKKYIQELSNEAIPNKNTGQTGELKNEFIIQPEFIIEEPKVEDKVIIFKKNK